jgi:chemotaxis methyl-accepting protein methylase
MCFIRQGFNRFYKLIALNIIVDLHYYKIDGPAISGIRHSTPAIASRSGEAGGLVHYYPPHSGGSGTLGILFSMNDEQFRRLVDYFQYSWSGYRKVRKGVKKRISRHMQELKCPNIETYLDLIQKNDQERQESKRRMTVSISRFFRDRKLWLDLENEILPRLIETEKEKLKVWSAGCARGEEIYSFKLVWERLTTRFDVLPELEIIATDMHPEYIQKAQAGIYTKSSLKEIPEEMRDDYFDRKKGGNRYDLKSTFKENIVWRIRNLFSDTPGSGFHIIFLRNNFLTYYRDDLIREPLTKILESLDPGGWLIIGSHEKLPDKSQGLTRKPSTPWAYRKNVPLSSRIQV